MKVFDWKHWSDVASAASLIGAFALPAMATAQEAAPAQADQPGVEDIVVTAQRRSERLQEVPIAITAVTAAAVQRAGVRGTEDLPQLVPALNITRNSNGLTPFLRGVGTFSSSPGQEASVPLYIDGAYVPQPTATFFSFNNIERIEVLKGPQGTLFGRNSSGGLIQIITRDPSDSAMIKGQASFANYGTGEGRLYASTPFGTNSGIDISLYGTDRAGGFGRNSVDHAKTGFHSEYGLRSKLKLQLADTLSLVLSADYSHLHSDTGVARRLVGSAKGSSGFIERGGFYDISSDQRPYVKTKGWGVSGTLNWDLNAVEITSISAYRKVNSFYALDTDAQPVLINNGLNSDYSKSFSEELQIKSATHADFNWIAGFYYFNYSAGFDPFTVVNPAGVRREFMDQNLDSYAGFAQANYEILPDTTLTLGARYTHDVRDFQARSPLPSRTIPLTSSKFNVWSWRASLDHKVSRNLLLYASASRGFKAGLFDPITPRNTPVQPEILTAYEAGFKSELFDHRVRFNASAFYYDISDIQLSALLGSTTILLNAAAARTYGLDADSTIAVSNDLNLSFGLSLLHSKYRDFPNAPLTRPAPLGGNITSFGSADGNDTTRAPKVSLNAGAFYTKPIGRSDLEASLNYSYQSRFFWAPDNRLKQPGHSLLNGELKLVFPSKAYFTIFGRNLTKTKYAVTTTSSSFADAYSPGAPRTYGVGFGFQF